MNKATCWRVRHARNTGGFLSERVFFSKTRAKEYVDRMNEIHQETYGVEESPYFLQECELDREGEL